MTDELSAVLNRRQQINDALDGGTEVKPQFKVVNVYTEFHEFSRKEIKEYEKTFKLYDIGGDGFLDLEELKRMMEKLKCPQTHMGLKTMIKEVDEDGDGKISFREFLLIFRKARSGELEVESGLGQLAKLTEINVDQVGVGGAKSFFEAKIESIQKSNKFEEEIRSEQEERKRDIETQKIRKQAFKDKAAMFDRS